MEEILNYITSTAFVGSAAVAIITFVLLFVIKKYLIKKVAYTNKDEQHKNTFIGVIFNILQYVVIIAAIVIIMDLHGVNVTSIVTGLGIMATIVGLSLQDTLKDIISGVNIYNNNFYKVGDAVMYNGELCDVKYFSARVTKFVSMATGNTYTVCNSTISSIEKVKVGVVIRMNFDFEDDKKIIDKCFTKAADAVKDMKYFKGFDYIGIVDMNEKGCAYVAVIHCPAHKSFDFKVAYLSELYKLMHKYGIEPSSDEERKILNLN